MNGSGTRRRAWKPKHRTGCITCKAAHVKCGEEKPGCARCRRLKLRCEYTTTGFRQHHAAASGTAPRQLVPLTAGLSDSIFASGPGGYKNLGPRRALYFDRFRYQVVYQLGSQPFDEFWLRTLLQDGARDVSVLEAVLGIGALAVALDTATRTTPLFRVHLLSYGSSEHYRAAVESYARSISTLRSRISSSTTAVEPRTLLVTAILYSIFEQLQGNSASVDRLMANGLSMLTSSNLTSSKAKARPSSAVTHHDEGFDQSRLLLLRRSIFGSLSSPIYPVLKSTMTNLGLPHIEGPGPPKILQSYQTFWNLWMQFFTSSSLWYIQAQFRGRGPLHDDARFEQERQGILDQTKSWEAALLHKLDSESSSDGRRTLRQMIPVAKTLFYTIYTTLQRTGRQEDKLEGMAKEIISLAEDSFAELPPLQRSQGEVYEGLHAIVFRMCMGCRDLRVRSRALALCRKMVDADSRWDTKGILMAISALVALEEQARDASGLIPPTSRYYWVHAAWINEYSELQVAFRARVAMPDGSYNRAEMTLRPKDFGLI
ncbi:hypothetical protein BX600DRAFT_85998 [Xylariales sp. PMI_506]|nr:hypothetical protein BX600DRAFT_85998 [Xylariales sp. PMI_506]